MTWPSDLGLLKNCFIKVGTVAHTFDPGTWEAEEGGSWVPGQPGLYIQFKDNQGYIMKKPYLEKTIQTKKPNTYSMNFGTKQRNNFL